MPPKVSENTTIDDFTEVIRINMVSWKVLAVLYAVSVLEIKCCFILNNYIINSITKNSA